MSFIHFARGVHFLTAFFIAASAIVLVDDSGVFGEHAALASTAEAIRGVGSGELAGGLKEFGDIKDGASRIADSFSEVARALN